MMKINTLLVLLIFKMSTSAQNVKPKFNDFQRIEITVLDCKTTEDISATTNSTIKNKINSMLTKNSLGGSLRSRFILVPVITLESKNILSTAPVKHIYTVNLTLYVGDGLNGTLFNSRNFRLKGVGESETKAYIDAVKSFNENSQRFKDYIVEAKNSIIQYYNAKCDMIISEAQTKAGSNEFDAALNILNSIPDVCLDCFKKVQPVIVKVYKQKIDAECKILLLQAKTEWSSSPNKFGAQTAGDYISKINPISQCYQEAILLNNEISSKLQSLDNRDWSLKVKQQQDQFDINKQIIRAARDIGVAYGENQPETKVIYRYSLWW